MKRSFLNLTILAGMLLFCLTASAQQNMQTPASPKAPEAIGKKLQSDKITNAPEPVVSPAITDQSQIKTPAVKASEVTPKITKINEPEQAKASQTSPQPVSVSPPPTDKLVIPKNHQTEMPDSKTAPVSAKPKE